jgi:phosphate transport system permease protein
MLGLGRAIGETMAVTMVIGSKYSLPVPHDSSSFSLFRPGYTMTSVLADQYPNQNSDLQRSALTQIAFTLFLVTMVVNGLARLLVWLTAMKTGGSISSRSSTQMKQAITFLLQKGTAAAFAGLVLFQTVQDVHARGISGAFGQAQMIGAAVAIIWLVNLKTPGTRLFLPWRKLRSSVGTASSVLCAVGATAALLLLFFYVFKTGIGALNGAFFHWPDPANPDAGGMMHAIAGTTELILMACVMGVPLGVLGGIYLSEFGNNRSGFWIRYATDLLNGVPSIVLGIFTFTLLIAVRTLFHLDSGGATFQGYAGGFALGIMMVPTVMRTTEELIKLVPAGLREGSLALGATHAHTVWHVVLPTARAGIVTGVLLAVARVAGETAPLLMIGCNSQLWNLDPRNAVASLPVQIYVLHDSPMPVALHQSWGVAVVLVLVVLVFNIIARVFTRNRFAAAK